jgi:hypothetical protein
MDQAELDFQNALQAAINESRRIGYPPTGLMGMITSSGAFEAVRTLLAKRVPSEGFTVLWEKGRLDLSVEAIVLTPEWRTYFSPQELDTARRRLADVGYQAPWDDGGTFASTNTATLERGTAKSAVGPSKPDETTPVVPPPIPDAEALITRIHSLASLPERNHEDVVKELLLRLGFDASEIVFQKGRIDLCVLTQDRKTAAIFEVKRTIAVESERTGARRQGMDYASQTGALIIVVTDGDRFDIYDRRKGHDYDAMLCGSFKLTAFRDTDAKTLDLLRPDNLRSVRT